MEQYTIRRISDRPEWETIGALQVKYAPWTEDFGIRMEQKMCYREDRLFVRQTAVERDIRAENRDPLDSVCEDSCMEFFFSPAAGDERYFNLEVNPLGNLYLGFRKNREEAARLILEDPQKQFSLRTGRTENGWEAEYEIPADFIALFFPGFRFVSGATMRGNCYKCGDLTPKVHYLTWNPMTSGTPDYHRPMDFGCFILE